MKRREFLESMAVLGVGSALLPSTASAMLATSGGAPKKKGYARLDEDLVCIISDLHVRPGYYQQEHFEKTIEEILALRPRPANVLCLGDIAYLTGKIEEYEAAKQGLSRLEEAGIRVAIAMGNHDRRANFAKVFPEKAAASELPHRMVYAVETPNADFILLDSLQEGENHDKWIVPGAIDEEQMGWLSAKLASYSAKPVFVMAHHPINETKVTKLLLSCPSCFGYIYGHNHKWDAGWTHVNYRDRRILRTLCVPSTGHWGDIGFALLRVGENQAVARIQLREFFFPNPLKAGEEKPAMWDEIEREHKNSICVFPFSKV